MKNSFFYALIIIICALGLLLRLKDYDRISGWLWSYGINYFARQAELQLVKTGDPKSDAIIKKYQIGYAIIGPVEISQGFRKNYFDENFTQVYSNSDYTIYKIK